MIKFQNWVYVIPLKRLLKLLTQSQLAPVSNLAASTFLASFIMPLFGYSQLIVNGENLNKGSSDTVVVYRDNLGRYSILSGKMSRGKWKPMTQEIKSGRGFKVEVKTPIQMINVLRDNGWEYAGVEVLALHQPNRPGEYVERAYTFYRLWRTRPEVPMPDTLNRPRDKRPWYDTRDTDELYR
jgi:hypothetical protein